MKRDFCSTVYIVKDEKLLLHLHPKFGKYLPAGGHLEKDETPIEAAHREIFEETGLKIRLIDESQDILNYPHAISLPKPFLCLLENVEQPTPHQHVDFIYLGIPIEDKEPLPPFRYYTYQEAEKIFDQGEMFEDVYYVIKKILLKDKALI